MVFQRVERWKRVMSGGPLTQFLQERHDRLKVISCTT